MIGRNGASKSGVIGRVAERLLPVFLGFALLYWLFALGRDGLLHLRLSREGVTTEAVVTSTRSVRFGTEARFEFQVEGKTYFGEFIGGKAGEIVTVRYLPTEPQRSEAVGRDKWAMAQVKSFGMIILGIVGVVAVFTAGYLGYLRLQEVVAQRRKGEG